MKDLSVAVGNFFYLVFFGCALIGFLVIWKQFAEAREIRRAKQLDHLSIRNSTSQEPVYDLQSQLQSWKAIAEKAELEAEAATVAALDAVQREKDARQEAELHKEEARHTITRMADDAARELAGALAEAAEEAERHWRAGLSQSERDAAWDAHWQNFEEPVRKAIEEQARWWRSMHRQ
jgi:hypothetical protein